MGFFEQGMFVPSRDIPDQNCFELSFRASSAFKLFEAGLRSLELSFRASSAFKLFEAGLRSLELSFRASSAFEIFEAGPRSLKLFLSGQQRLQAIRSWVSTLRIALFDPVVHSKNSSSSCRPLNHLFRACNIVMLFNTRTSEAHL
jgi:hypothetical protein